MTQLNHEEFELAFKAYYVAVLRYCMTIVKDVDDAQDIVQQAFLKIWLKREEIDTTELRAYVYKSVYHASLDHLKRRQIKMKYHHLITNLPEHPAFPEQSSSQELGIAIRKAIDVLPEQCRKIFQMSRFDQLKYREIAAALQLSVKTVENQMGKALKMLRERLKEYLPLLLIVVLYSK